MNVEPEKKDTQQGPHEKKEDDEKKKEKEEKSLQEAKWHAEIRSLEERLRRDYDPTAALRDLVKYMDECIPPLMYELPHEESSAADFASFLDDKGRYFLYNGLQSICQAILSKTYSRIHTHIFFKSPFISNSSNLPQHLKRANIPRRQFFFFVKSKHIL